MTHWHCAQVEPTRERRVCERLAEQGADTWRHDLLPGYVLARGIHPARMRYTENVTRVLPFSDAPQPIPDDVMLVLQETCRAYEQAATTHKGGKPDHQPIAGMARKMVANLLSSWASRVTIGSERVESTDVLPARGQRSVHAHQARRKAKRLAGAEAV